MEFKVLSLEDCDQVRLWRNQTPESLRTSFQLTKEQQEEFFNRVINDRNAKSRYWGIWGNENGVNDEAWRMLIGMAGIENIEWENGRGEISLILSKQYRGLGHGETAFAKLMDKAFGELGLRQIWGECYVCNNALFFWQHIVEKWKGYSTTLPQTKLYDRFYYDSLYFSFERGNQ